MQLRARIYCKIYISLLFYFKWIFLKILEFIYFSSFTITLNFPYQLVTDMCEPVLKYLASSRNGLMVIVIFLHKVEESLSWKS